MRTILIKYFYLKRNPLLYWGLSLCYLLNLYDSRSNRGSSDCLITLIDHYMDKKYINFFNYFYHFLKKNLIFIVEDHETI